MANVEGNPQRAAQRRRNQRARRGAQVIRDDDERQPRLRNLVHQAALNGPRADPDDQQRRQPGVPRNPEPVAPPPAEEVRAEPQPGDVLSDSVCILHCPVAIRDYEGYIITQAGLFKLMQLNNRWVAASGTGVIHPTIRPGELVPKAAQGGYGCVHKFDKSKNHCAALPWIEQRSVGETKMFRNTTYTVAPAVLSFLNRECPVRGSAVLANLDVINRVVAKQYNAPPILEVCIAETVRFYVHKAQFDYEQQTRLSWDAVDAFVTGPMRATGPIIRQTRVVRIEGVNCELPFDWDVKPWVTVKVGGNFLEDVPGFIRRLHEGAIEAKIPEQRIWKSQFFRFRGQRDFVLYNPSSVTFARGLRRVLACKKNPVRDRGLRGFFIGMSDVDFDTTLREYQLMRCRDSLEVIGRGDGGVLDMYTFEERVRMRDCVQHLIETVSDRLYKMHCVRPTIFTDVADAISPAYARIGDRAERLTSSALSCLDYLGIINKSTYTQAWFDMSYKFQDECHKVYVASVEHQKKKLRQAIQNFRWDARMKPRDYHKVIKLNVKKEWAKPGKASRLFASYGDGALLCPELPDFLKLGLFGFLRRDVGGLVVDTLILSICTPETLAVAFEFLRTVPECPVPCVAVVIYSDDAVVGTNCGGTRWYNVDKVSKDSSAQEFEFRCVHEILRRIDLEAANALVQQCKLPFEFMSTEGVCFIDAPHPKEGSGTVLTTVLNHVDNGMFGTCISAFAEEVLQGKVEEAMRLSAFAFGHDISIEPCEVFEKVQFVKRSPVQLMDGSWSFMTNLGCRYRSLGTCDGDLTHISLGVDIEEWRAMSWRDRGERLVGNVVQSWVNEPANELDDAFRARFKGSSNHQQEVSFEYQGGGSSKAADPASLDRRYPGWLDHAREVSQQIVEVGLFDEVVSPLFATIYNVDYGLPLA